MPFFQELRLRKRRSTQSPVHIDALDIERSLLRFSGRRIAKSNERSIKKRHLRAATSDPAPKPATQEASLPRLETGGPEFERRAHDANQLEEATPASALSPSADPSGHGKGESIEGAARGRLRLSAVRRDADALGRTGAAGGETSFLSHPESTWRFRADDSSRHSIVPSLPICPTPRSPFASLFLLVQQRLQGRP